jgi:FtsP/CotA-like multicopper oxidase with cupredoxin domain
VNAAVSRYFKLALEGGEWVRVGGDGGLLAAPEPVTELLLIPGERADVLVLVPQAGTTATLRALPYQRAVGAGSTRSVDVLRLVASADPPATPAELPASLRAIDLLAPSGASRVIRLNERMEGDHPVFTINGAEFPDVPVITGALGTVEPWEIVNESVMDHPFHVHGFFFQLEGQAEWRDTINVPASSTLRLRVDFAPRDGAVGSWMYHCHIVGHQEGGMMGELVLE